jgi:DNA-binding MarR family transcriptional regulator
MVDDVKAALATVSTIDDAGRPLTAEDLDAITVLGITATALSQQAADVLAGVGFPSLRPSHARLFAALLAGPTPVSALAQTLAVTPQAISKMLGPLLDEGYVEMRRGDDGRVRLVSLAKRGREAVLAARLTRSAVAAEHHQVLDRVRTELLQLLDELDLLGPALARAIVP